MVGVEREEYRRGVESLTGRRNWFFVTLLPDEVLSGTEKENQLTVFESM